MAKTKPTNYDAETEARRKDIRQKLSEMYDFYAESYDYISEQLKYSAGEQWDEKIAQARKAEGMPTVTVPLLQTYINRVVNEYRKNPIGMQVEFEDDNVSDILSGLLRQIERTSRATEVYEKAHDNQVSGGLGWIRVGLEYANDETTDLEIKLYKVTDPNSCFIDPYHQLPDGSDARFGAYVSYISKHEAEMYGDEVYEAACDIDLHDNDLLAKPDDAVTEIIFYELVEEQITRNFRADGSYYDGDEEIEVGVVASRKVSKKSCKVTKIVGQKIVEEVVLPIPFILLVPVKGNELQLTDKRLVGMPHWAKSSQDAINLYTSTEMQLVANAPKSPIIMAEGQDEGHPEWDDINTKNFSKVSYKPTTYDDGTPVPAPYRLDNTAQTQFAIQGRVSASENLGRSLGMFDNMLGEMSYSGESAAAMKNRTIEGQIGVLHYIQNLQHSIEQVCRLVVHLIPYAYNTEREIAVYDTNGKKQKIRAKLDDIITSQMIKDVDFVMTSGPMIKSNEEENVNNIMRIAQLLPNKVEFIGDIIAEQLGGAVSEQLSNRLKKTLPPEMQENSNKEPDPQVQQMLQQADAQMAELQAQNEYLEGIVRQLQADAIADKDKNKTDIIQTVIKAEADLAKERIKQSSEDERLQEKIEAEASKDMFGLAKEVIADDTAEITTDMAAGSEDYVPRVAGPVTTAEPEDFIEFEDEEDELTFE